MKTISRKARTSTITLYNYVSTTNAIATYQRTVIKNVYLDTGYAQRLSQRGISVTDRAQLIIDIGDLQTTNDRVYKPYIEWQTLTDKTGYFTLSSTNDFFIEGDVADTLPSETKTTMMKKYPVYSVSSVSDPKQATILLILGK